MPPYSSVDCICEICGQTFKVQPYRFKTGSHGGRFCSRLCYHSSRRGQPIIPRIKVASEQIESEYRDGATLEQIGNRYGMTIQAVAARLNTLGVYRRLPTGANFKTEENKRKVRESHLRGAAHPMYVQMPDEELKDRYESGESIELLANRYGLKPAGIRAHLRRAGVVFPRNGYDMRRVCADGCITESGWEWAVHEWLVRHKMGHEMHPRCPWKPIWPATHHHADFLVDGIYIEVWGMMGRRQYEERRQRKMAHYRERQIPVIQIFPHNVLDDDYSPLEQLLR